MVISKKKFDEAIKAAKEEVFKEVDKNEYLRNQERWYSERFDDIDRRISKAFVDIDRRLSELEKNKSYDNCVPLCPKY